MLKYVVIAALLAFALGENAWGQSQQPPRPQTPRSESAQQTNPDQRGTDNVPFTVKILPAHPPQEETDKIDREKAETAAIDRKLAFETQRIADYTKWLSTVTFLLFCIAVIQAGLFVWQLGYMRQGVKDTAEAAEAATKQAQIAQRTFEALERPYVFVFGLSGIESLPDEGSIPKVKYNVANYGKVAAIIDEVLIVISSVGNGVPETPVLVDLNHPLMISPVIAPGDHRKRIAYVLPEGATGIHDDPQFIGAQQGLGLEPNLNPNEDLLAKIIIRYHGPFTLGHVSSVAWRWDKLTKGFVVIADLAQTFNR